MNILLLSIIYPLPSKDNKGTFVCHYFTKEWVKMGYNVRVIHVQAVYPKVFYWFAKLNEKKIAAKTGALVYTKRQKKIEEYVMDGVPVLRVPVFKPIPHGKFSNKAIRKAVQCIVSNCKGNSFIPDVIIGHFPNPQIEMLGMLKSDFSAAKNCIVMHGDITLMRKVYGERLPALMKNIDMWGFRSNFVLELFESVAGKVNNPFMCFSGIPAQYITKKNMHDFTEPLRRFVYVGSMIDRKYPEKVLEALELAYPDNTFNMTYVGDGQQLEIIKREVEIKRLQQQVSILGRIPRDKIIEEYDKADCMVMISRGEAYGLVYLEAMARGCITIASRNEGFDGVIVDGENGFLCKAGDSKELSEIIQRINALAPEERQKISDNAIATAVRLTDKNAAKLYIDDVISRM